MRRAALVRAQISKEKKADGSTDQPNELNSFIQYKESMHGVENRMIRAAL